MSTSTDSGPASVCDSADMQNLSMTFPQPGSRLIVEVQDRPCSDIMCLWILVGDEDRYDWNAWIYAYNDKGEWVCRGTEWWWGKYEDWNRSTHSEVAPALG